MRAIFSLLLTVLIGSAQNAYSSEVCNSALINGSALTQGESNAVSKYSAGKGYEMNFYLRTQKFLIPNNEALIKGLIPEFVAALAKFPNFSGLVLRGAPLPHSQLAKLTPVGLFDEQVLKIGSIITDPSFVSASTEISVVRDWYLPDLKDYGLFKIHSKSAKMVPASLQVNGAGEKEVIFLPGTKFKVISVSDQSDGLKLIELYEL